MIGDAVVGVVGTSGVVHRAEVGPGRREHGQVGLAVNVLNGALLLVLWCKRWRRMHRPEGDVPREGEQCRFRQEETKLIEVSWSTPANNWTRSEVMAQVRMTVKKIVGDITDQENDELVLVGFIVEQDPTERSLSDWPFGKQVGLG